MYTSRNGTKKVGLTHSAFIMSTGYWYMPAKNQERILLYRVDRIRQFEILHRTDDSIPTLKDWLISEDNRASVEVVLQFTDFGARLAESDTLFRPVQHN